jgi:hypothetical protein
MSYMCSTYRLRVQLYTWVLAIIVETQRILIAWQNISNPFNTCWIQVRKSNLIGRETSQLVERTSFPSITEVKPMLLLVDIWMGDHLGNRVFQALPGPTQAG